MSNGTSGARTTAWRAFGIVAAIVLYAISMSGDVYDLTSPASLPQHELVRKIYALLAFALLGFVLERSRLRRVHGVLAAGIALTAYSYAIELSQIAFARSTETFAEHSFDVASGLVGGALGALVALLIAAPAGRARRVEAAAVAVALALLGWGFVATYGRLD